MTMPIPVLARQQPLHPLRMPPPQPSVRPLPARGTPVLPAARVGDDVFALCAETVTVERDTVLFYEGDAARAVYRVVEGMVRISCLLPDGRRHVVDFLQAGDVIGLTVAETHAHTAEAVTPATLCRMPRSRLEAAMDERPALARKLVARTQADLAAAHERLLLLGRKSVLERLATLLLLLRDRQPDSPVVPLPMGRTDIADYLGLTVETVSRNLSKLKSGGLIRLLDTYTVEILDPERLAEIAAGN